MGMVIATLDAGASMDGRNGAQLYDSVFYSNQVAGSLASAEIIVAYILARCGGYVKSVVDFGCGVGAWLSVFEKYGKAVRGYDFGAGLTGNLLIDSDKFKVIDLSHPMDKSQPYDLALCLEVAEHLDEKSADDLLGRIVESSRLVLFSAAIPGQGGVGHINEQYQSYWISKFSSLGFECYDMIRPKFWNNDKIMFWYRQNMFIFKKTGVVIPGIDESSKVDIVAPGRIVDAVHPELIADKTRKMRFLMRKLDELGGFC